MTFVQSYLPVMVATRASLRNESSRDDIGGREGRAINTPTQAVPSRSDGQLHCTPSLSQ